MDNNLIIIISAAVAVFLIAILVILKFTGKKEKKDTFIITGICDSGKTSLFLKLRNDKIKETHTSIAENEGRFPLAQEDEDKIFHIIDFPGHYKLRYKYQDFTPITKGVIFVIDSATFTRNERDVTEYLYEILANKHIAENEVSILIVCNKQDYLIALPKERIKTSLENEINNLRSTRAAGVEQQDEDNVDDFLGYENEAFKFEHLPNQVTFVECELKSDNNPDSGVKEIKDWMIENY
ncbi:P-loop containing nucleoside triphosphate hydrolase protein [Neocallimastix lanati (nom. inval.)]|jgi:signal recognition particle receptor subunit beta|uniref:Signal recognition particle receptor subunit beta n=1 Tax=Neocallimastix californiae TaxID=1754190 RepID=A0A1Y2EMM1_9FUNG|nr:P-loop containing nucleoside triphosphate hydrolase protein [Neocallimastix sp. JGI-2020a]ORY72803.1 P-loop containing nucleoside triphosphate hydrolase protein [Neocallimastix californiae]|eukprot:ORY72803.1 P-loop containing nucleoside triphosphate hydrolase protein [Neocallimastix californiae]